MPELVGVVEVDAPPQRVWDRAVDWERQGEWIPATRSRATAGDGRGVGAEIDAWTGLGPLGFHDTMVITAWEPPHRCGVRHTGRVVRGAGAFEVLELPHGRARFVWSEWVEVPFGMAGQLGWLALRPLFRFGLRRALARFARQVTSDE